LRSEDGSERERNGHANCA